MFFPRRDPAEIDPGRLAALRLSLNAPVVSVAELPAGPARAAIALWWEAEERPVLEVRLRSLATGQRVVYGFEEPLEGARDVERALEAGLNFAEGMGFLFDEDVLSADDTADRVQVREAWAEFATTGEGAAEPAARPEEAAEPEDEAALLELTDLAEPAPAAPAVPPQLDPEPASAPPTLSKFRGRAETPAAPDPAPAPAAAPAEREGGLRAALGRVPLVRRRRAPERPSLLLRILGAF